MLFLQLNWSLTLGDWLTFLVTIIGAVVSMTVWLNKRLSKQDERISIIESFRAVDVKSLKDKETSTSKELEKIERKLDDLGDNINSLKVNLAQANFTAMSNRIDRLEIWAQQELKDIRHEFKTK